jgi:hypothetical protein
MAPHISRAINGGQIQFRGPCVVFESPRPTESKAEFLYALYCLHSRAPELHRASLRLHAGETAFPSGNERLTSRTPGAELPVAFL